MANETNDLANPPRIPYSNDPLARGNGLGLVLHERGRQWMVVNVLKESPAQYAGAEVGDVLLRVDDYDLEDGDPLELVSFIRSEIHKQQYDLTVLRANRNEVRLHATPMPMLDIFQLHRNLGGGSDGFCRTCKSCRQTNVGWADCGLDAPDPISGKKCSGRCLIA